VDAAGGRPFRVNIWWIPSPAGAGGPPAKEGESRPRRSFKAWPGSTADSSSTGFHVQKNFLAPGFLLSPPILFKIGGGWGALFFFPPKKRGPPVMASSTVAHVAQCQIAAGTSSVLMQLAAMLHNSSGTAVLRLGKVVEDAASSNSLEPASSSIQREV